MKGDFSNASEAFKARNPHLFGVGRLPHPVAQPAAPALESALPKRQAGARGGRRGDRRPAVTIVSFRRRLISDQDNLVAGAKALRDAIARWLNVDDADRVVRWEYGQVQTAGEEGTVVRIEIV